MDIADESSPEKQAILGKPGKVLLEDDFYAASCPRSGGRERDSGRSTTGSSRLRKSRRSSRRLCLRRPRFPYKDIVAEFSFKFDGSTGCHFMMEDSNYKGSHAGHIIRAAITPTSAQLADSKFGSMKTRFTKK